MKKLILTFIAMFVVCLAVQAETVPKIGVFNIEEIIVNFFETKEAWDHVIKLSNEINAELDRIEDEIRQLETLRLQAINAGNDSLALEYQEDINQKKEYNKSYYQVMSDKLQDAKDSVLNNDDNMRKILKAISTIGESEGYGLILDSKTGEIWWHSPVLDITDLVKRRLGIQ